jgi:hypothetical protein
MRFFPQLESGSLAQYPVVLRHKARTIVNESIDNWRILFADDRARQHEWDLEFRGLTGRETSRIADLFEQSEGSLYSFCFLDPAGNLLSYSEDMSHAAWAKGAALLLTGGVSDPWGTARATRVVNGGQIVQSTEQTLDVPGSYTYCFSGYFRGSVAGRIRLGWKSGADGLWQESEIGPAWRRIQCTGAISGEGTPTTFGIEVPAGTSLDLAGLQVEGQREASAYQKTAGLGGVYQKARFRDDSLVITCEGIDDYTVKVSIAAPDGLES